MKEELYEALKGHGVKYLETRYERYNGLDTVLVCVFATDRDEPHECRFSVNESVEIMATAIQGLLRNRT